MNIEKKESDQSIKFILLLTNKEFLTAEKLLLKLSSSDAFGEEFILELYERGSLLSKDTKYFGESFKERVTQALKFSIALNIEYKGEELFSLSEKEDFLIQLEDILLSHENKIRVAAYLYNQFSLDRSIIDAMLLTLEKQGTIAIKKEGEEVFVGLVEKVIQQ